MRVFSPTPIHTFPVSNHSLTLNPTLPLLECLTLARVSHPLTCPTQSDRDILEHIVYDFGDHEMMEALRPSIEEAQPIHSQQLALDYIGKRASQVGLWVAGVLIGFWCQGGVRVGFCGSSTPHPLAAAGT